jgi:hypothetical protein
MNKFFEALSVAFVIFLIGAFALWISGVYRVNNQHADQRYSEVYGESK